MRKKRQNLGKISPSPEERNPKIQPPQHRKDNRAGTARAAPLLKSASNAKTRTAGIPLRGCALFSGNFAGSSRT